jgi:uncharacterized protein YjbI with pentapeptide repeats
VFDEATLEDCDLSQANLEGTTWRNAVATRCIATGAVFFDARLDASQFAECDFRNADFQAQTAGAVSALESFKFVRCDLRDTNGTGRVLSRASFVDCKLFGAHGEADGLADAAIDHADLSPAGDGSVLGTSAAVLAGWRSDASRPPARRTS